MSFIVTIFFSFSLFISNLSNFCFSLSLTYILPFILLLLFSFLSLQLFSFSLQIFFICLLLFVLFIFILFCNSCFCDFYMVTLFFHFFQEFIFYYILFYGPSSGISFMISFSVVEYYNSFLPYNLLITFLHSSTVSFSSYIFFFHFFYFIAFFILSFPCVMCNYPLFKFFPSFFPSDI